MKTNRVYRSMVADTIAPNHFLKKVFKKKPGGTVIGNLIRVGVNKATGGVLGTGANRLPVSSAPSQTPILQSDASKSIQEKLAAKAESAMTKAVESLSAKTREMLANNQTDASNLPKTQALKQAERVAEGMTERGEMTSGGQMLGGNMLYYLGGAFVLVIIVVLATRK